MNSCPDRLILFDGVCHFCDATIQFIIRRDRQRILRYASLQSATGREISNRHNLPLENYQTFVYLKNNQVYLKSNAVLELCKDLGFPWRGLYPIKFILPLFLRDFLYSLVSRNRYLILGKKDSCSLPTAETRRLFMD
ncbi:DUF393 domain-containing protein [bacterium SCSIO 12741]|nr:DUF393 domain-containing protein [bacterium SCSIO 12741]